MGAAPALSHLAAGGGRAHQDAMHRARLSRAPRRWHRRHRARIHRAQAVSHSAVRTAQLGARGPRSMPHDHERRRSHLRRPADAGSGPDAGLRRHEPSQGRAPRGVATAHGVRRHRHRDCRRGRAAHREAGRPHFDGTRRGSAAHPAVRVGRCLGCRSTGGADAVSTRGARRVAGAALGAGVPELPRGYGQSGDAVGAGARGSLSSL